MADALASGASGENRGGSSPLDRTIFFVLIAYLIVYVVYIVIVV